MRYWYRSRDSRRTVSDALQANLTIPSSFALVVVTLLDPAQGEDEAVGLALEREFFANNSEFGVAGLVADGGETRKAPLNLSVMQLRANASSLAVWQPDQLVNRTETLRSWVEKRCVFDSDRVLFPLRPWARSHRRTGRSLLLAFPEPVMGTSMDIQ